MGPCAEFGMLGRSFGRVIRYRHGLPVVWLLCPGGTAADLTGAQRREGVILGEGVHDASPSMSASLRAASVWRSP